MVPRVSLITITLDKLLLFAIRDFLLNQLDSHSKLLGTETKLINITDKKTRVGNNKPISILEIYQIDYICNILIPYLNNFKFRTKKYLDYLDWKEIALLILDNRHYTEEGLIKTDSVRNSMNRKRTYFNWDHLSKLS